MTMSVVNYALSALAMETFDKKQLEEQQENSKFSDEMNGMGKFIDNTTYYTYDLF